MRQFENISDKFSIKVDKIQFFLYIFNITKLFLLRDYINLFKIYFDLIDNNNKIDSLIRII